MPKLLNSQKPVCTHKLLFSKVKFFVMHFIIIALKVMGTTESHLLNCELKRHQRVTFGKHLYFLHNYILIISHCRKLGTQKKK